MKQKENEFIFKDYEFNLKKKQILFRYEISLTSGKKYNFTEKLELPNYHFAMPISEQILKKVLAGLHLMLGISYYKTFCPEKIIIEENKISQSEASFWNDVYTQGLGEFFYKNNIDYRDLIHFPVGTKDQSQKFFLPRINRSLVAVGGGKDSLVTIELLKKIDKPFAIFNLNNPLVTKLSQEIDSEQYFVKRTIDPLLLQLNQNKSVYNGHIPISGIYAFISLLIAVLYNFKYLIFSNEKSANVGNIFYFEKKINHQWSKSEEFEKMMQNYISNFITSDIKYFSLLRPIYEIEIVRRFIQTGKYSNKFVSCNRNFRLGKSKNIRWCGDCPKCLFVFCLFAAFLPKKEVINIFGNNFFDSPKFIDIFKGLLGEKSFIKPFDCVGTHEEMLVALYMIFKKQDFNDSFLLKLFVNDILPYQKGMQKMNKKVFKLYNFKNIPEEFKNCYS